MPRSHTRLPRENPPDPMIIVRPPPTKRERLFHIMGRVTYWFFRVLFLLLIFALCSIGITALLNEPLRNILFEQLQIGGIL